VLSSVRDEISSAIAAAMPASGFGFEGERALRQGPTNLKAWGTRKAGKAVIWHFQDFELDDGRFELRRGGEHVRIAPKPLALLVHLAKRYPASVSRQELFRTLWPGVRVTDASLARAVLAARHAIAKDRHAEGVIRTIRGRGYALGDACRPQEAPGPPAVSSDHKATFVGRIAEVARIEAALDRVALGQGRLLFITGEAGIGKSRLLQELTARAQVRHAVVIIGHCLEDDGAPPYWPWSEILHALLDECEDHHLRFSVERLIGDLTPRRAEPPRGHHARAALTDADARFRLFHDVTEVLCQAARDRPLIVLLEDLHWAGPGALHLLRFVGRSLATASALIAMTYRNTGPSPNPVLEATAGELSALSHALPELRLAPFSNDEIVAYVRNLAGQTDADLVRRLQEAAGGNPLFLRELLPGFAAPAVGGVPASIDRVVRSQVARLSGPARALIDIASVNGRTIPPQLLARVSRCRLETVLEGLDEASAENLVERDRSGHFRFKHDIIRAALSQALRPARRMELHQRVARAIEAGAQPEARLAELAHHFFEALPLSGPDKAIHYATRAAEAARRALDFDGAALHYRQALAALQARPSATAAARCDLLLQLGEVLELAGQLTQSREAIVEAAQLARALRSFLRLGRAALAVTAWQQAVVADSVAVQLVVDALRAVGQRPIALRARLLAKLAVLRQVQGDQAAASRLFGEALTLAKRLDDVLLHCDVLVQQLIMLQLGVFADHAARLAFTMDLLRVAERAETRYAILQCRRQRIALLLDSGAGAELDQEIERFASESAVARCKQNYVAGFRAMRAIVSGRFKEARQAIDEAESLADPLSLEEHRLIPIMQRFTLPPQYRDSAALERALREVMSNIPRPEEWRIPHALVALDLQQADVARAALHRVAADDFALVQANGKARTPRQVANVAALAEVSWRLGEPRHARRLRDMLLPHAGTQATTGLGMVYRGPVDWYLGVLAVLLGRRCEAARHFKVALATTERLGAWPWHARTALAYAELLAAGSAAEQRRARALAASAADTTTRLRIDILRRQAERLIAKLGRTRNGVHPPRPGARNAPKSIPHAAARHRARGATPAGKRRRRHQP
jgi:DNA-binding winged helix-turn-helix (wHTH) protein